MTTGRGVRRRRRKKGLTKICRLEMTTGYRYVYKVEYDMRQGDIFRFRHRHQVIDCSKAFYPLPRKRSARYPGEKLLDFPKGSIILWTGSCFITEFGNFVPRKSWWESFPALVDPVGVAIPKRVRLRILTPPRKTEIKPKMAIKPSQKLSFLTSIKAIFQ